PLLPGFSGAQELSPPDQPHGADQSEGLMRRRGLRILLLFAVLAAAPVLCLAFEEQSLLTPDGTLHALPPGRASDLGFPAPTPSPDSFAIYWGSRAQDGTVMRAIVPGTLSYQEKR